MKDTLFTLNITSYVDIEKPRFKVDLIGHTEYGDVSDHFDDPEDIHEVVSNWQNPFKWFCAEIKVTCNVTGLHDSTYLGCCSYNDENDLLEEFLPNYGQDMVDETKASVLTAIEDFRVKLNLV